MQLTEEQIESIYESCHDKWLDSGKCINLWHTFAKELLAAHSAGAQEPIKLAPAELPGKEGLWLDEFGQYYDPTHPQPMTQTDAARDAWSMVCGDWRDETVAVHGPNGHIESGLTIEQARAIIDAHGGKCASDAAEIERLDRAKEE